MSDQILASSENGIIKTPKDLLIAAEKKIGELQNQIRTMEDEAKAGVETIDKLKWQTAQLRIAVTAMGEHFNCPPEEFKKIYDAYCDKQNAEVQKLADEAKAKFIQELKDGKVPEFKVMNRETGELVNGSAVDNKVVAFKSGE
jgi:hypothetical protein